MLIWVVMPDWQWSSEDQNQQKARSIAFCGSSETIAPRLSALFLMFLLEIRPWTFSAFSCSWRSHFYHQELVMEHLSVASGLMPHILHWGPFWMSEKLNQHVDCRETVVNTHKYPANKFSEGSIATASAYLNFDFKPACPINWLMGLQTSKQLQVYPCNLFSPWFLFCSAMCTALSGNSHLINISILEKKCFLLQFFQNNLQSCQNE